MNKNDIKKFDHAIASLLKTRNNIASELSGIFNNGLLGVHARAMSVGKGDEVFNMLNILKKGFKYKYGSRNYHTKTFLKDNMPELYNNTVFMSILSEIYNTSKKGVGKGEFLLKLLFPEATEISVKTKKGDLLVGKQLIEVKDVEHKATCKAYHDSSHRPSNNLFQKIYGEHIPRSSNRQIWEGTNKQFHEYCQKLYPSLYNKSVFDEIFRQKSLDAQEQKLGYHVLLEYQKIDKFDRMIVMKMHKNDIEILFINDFKKASYLESKLKFKPTMYRGRGTQAVADGYADIKFSK